MSRLHIYDIQGREINDFFSRQIDNLYPLDAYEKRLEILERELKAIGSSYDNLNLVTKRQLTYITDIDALPRLVLKLKPSSFYYEIDALATSMRLAWVLAKRRNGGHNNDYLAFVEVSSRLLKKNQLATNIYDQWRACIEFILRSDREWTHEIICSFIKSSPIVLLFHVINNTYKVPWLSAVESITGLQWLSKELSLLLYENPPRYNPKGPISDLIFAKSINENIFEDVIVNTILAMDIAAENTYKALEGYKLPRAVEIATQAIYEYSKVVFCGLEQKGFV